MSTQLFGGRRGRPLGEFLAMVARRGLLSNSAYPDNQSEKCTSTTGFSVVAVYK